MSNRSFRLTASSLALALAVVVTAAASPHDQSARQSATGTVAATAQDQMAKASPNDFDPHAIHRFEP